MDLSLVWQPGLARKHSTLSGVGVLGRLPRARRGECPEKIREKQIRGRQKMHGECGGGACVES